MKNIFFTMKFSIKQTHHLIKIFYYEHSLFYIRFLLILSKRNTPCKTSWCLPLQLFLLSRADRASFSFVEIHTQFPSIQQFHQQFSTRFHDLLLFLDFIRRPQSSFDPPPLALHRPSRTAVLLRLARGGPLSPGHCTPPHQPSHRPDQIATSLMFTAANIREISNIAWAGHRSRRSSLQGPCPSASARTLRHAPSQEVSVRFGFRQ